MSYPPGRVRRGPGSAAPPQCPAVGLWDGANCCVLPEGHSTPHENAFGSRMEGCTWGTAEQAHEYIASLYFQEEDS